MDRLEKAADHQQPDEYEVIIIGSDSEDEDDDTGGGAGDHDSAVLYLHKTIDLTQSDDEEESTDAENVSPILNRPVYSLVPVIGGSAGAYRLIIKNAPGSITQSDTQQRISTDSGLGHYETEEDDDDCHIIEVQDNAKVDGAKVDDARANDGELMSAPNGAAVIAERQEVEEEHMQIEPTLADTPDGAQLEDAQSTPTAVPKKRRRRRRRIVLLSPKKRTRKRQSAAEAVKPSSEEGAYTLADLVPTRTAHDNSPQPLGPLPTFSARQTDGNNNRRSTIAQEVASELANLEFVFKRQGKGAKKKTHFPREPLGSTCIFSERRLSSQKVTLVSRRKSTNSSFYTLEDLLVDSLE